MGKPRANVIGFEPHPQMDGVYLDAVGKLIVAFGGIELLSHAWIAEMARDELLVDLAAELSLDRRVNLVLELLQRERMPQKWKRRSRELWLDVKQLAEIRDIVTRSPIVLAPHGRSAAEVLDMIGVPDLKSLKRRNGRPLPLTPISGLRRSIETLAPVAQSLAEHLEAFRVRTRKRKRLLSRRAA